MEFHNPAGMAAPQSAYSHGVEVPASARRLIVAGQVAARADGSVPEGMAAQLEQCWRNVFSVLAAAGMTKRDLTRVVVYVTEPDAVAQHRETRDRLLEGHRPAVTFLQVTALAAPRFLCEIEAEAAAP